MFWTKKDANEEWRRFRDGELHSFYRLSNVVRLIKSIRLRWAVIQLEWKKARGLSKILIGKPTGKEPSGKPRRRWEANIRMNFKQMGIIMRDDLAQDWDNRKAFKCGVEPPYSISHS